MVTKIIAFVQSYFYARDVQNALAELSDAALADIGLTRAEIAVLSARSAPARTSPAAAGGGLRMSLAFQPAAQAA